MIQNEKTKKSRKGQLLNFIWLLTGCILLVFVSGKWNIPLVAWLAPVFIMRYVRQQESWKKVIIAYPFIAVASGISWYGQIPLPLVGFILFVMFSISILTIIPFVIDRIAFRKINNPLISTLIFPSLTTLLAFLSSLGPYGTWGVVGYSQFGLTPLMQLTSITGIWGIGFLISWLSPIINTLWAKKFDIRSYKKPIVVYVSIFILIFLAGGLRLSVFESSSKTVKVGSTTVSLDDFIKVDEFQEYFLKGAPREEAESYKEGLKIHNDSLFKKSLKLVEAGSKIVFWSEANAAVFKENEPVFIERAQSFAREHNIYLFVAMATFEYGNNKAENKVIAIEPDGNIAFTYLKALPVPGEPSIKGDGELHVLDTPFGRLSTTICFDMDFPNLLKQAGNLDVDILLVPASDWKEIDPMHTQMAMFRGIENGFSVVRHANPGLSMACDCKGNILAQTDSFEGGDKSMIVDVPVKGAKTLYSFLGDWFVYVSTLFLLIV